MARHAVLVALARAGGDATTWPTTVEATRAGVAGDAACAERPTLPADAARDGDLVEAIGRHRARAHEDADREATVAARATASTACRGTTTAARGVLGAVAVAAADTIAIPAT